MCSSDHRAPETIAQTAPPEQGRDAVEGCGETSFGRLELAIPSERRSSIAEGDLDGGPFRSEKRDVRERGDVRRPMNVIESGSSLSKWLERSPPMSYPRSWQGKVARIKGVDGLSMQRLSLT